jgi:hypothetical protein
MASDFRPATLDIKIWKNDTWSQTFALTANSTPIDLSTATVRIQIRKGCGGTLMVTLTNGDGITIGGVGNNEITIGKIISIDKGNYFWDMEVTQSVDSVKTYLTGDFIVYDDITK